MLPVCAQKHWFLLMVLLHKNKPSVVYHMDSMYSGEEKITLLRLTRLDVLLPVWVKILGCFPPEVKPFTNGEDAAFTSHIPVEY